MQRVADLVRTGHARYVAGSIPVTKAPYLANKLSRLYLTDLTRLEQSRRRARGNASARLLMWRQEKEAAEQISWLLLVTQGALPTGAEREKWRDALDRRERIVVDGYELVRITKPCEPRPVWTWRYRREVERAWRESLIRAIRTRRDDELRQHIQNLWRSPGFAGVRQQVKKFGQLIRSEWQRSRRTDRLPEIPVRIGYVRRLRDVGVSLSTVSNTTERTRQKYSDE